MNQAASSPQNDQQAARLRRMTSNLRSQVPSSADRVAVVLGAKGGVGATTVALAIARDIARGATPGGGVSVLAIDAHPGRNDLAMLAAGQQTPGLALTTAAKLGVAAPATSAGAGEASKRLLRAGRLWTEEAGGWIVIDAGVADSPWARDLAAHAYRPLLVTTPDRLATMNAYALLKRVGRTAERISVIVNHCAGEASAREAFEPIVRSAEQFLRMRPSLAGWLETTKGDASAATIAAAA